MVFSSRKVVIDLLIPYFETDSRLHLLIGDMGFSVTDQIQARFPNRVTNCGVMEQGMVGIAAGMAIGGMLPVVYSMPNFLCIRALEQIRNDIILQNLNVKLLGTGAGVYLAHLGKSHCGGDLDANFMDLIGMPVWNGCGEWQTESSFGKMVHEWITSDKAGYLRV